MTQSERPIPSVHAVARELDRIVDKGPGRDPPGPRRMFRLVLGGEEPPAPSVVVRGGSLQHAADVAERYFRRAYGRRIVAASSWAITYKDRRVRP